MYFYWWEKNALFILILYRWFIKSSLVVLCRFWEPLALCSNESQDLFLNIMAFCIQGLKTQNREQMKWLEKYSNRWSPIRPRESGGRHWQGSKSKWRRKARSGLWTQEPVPGRAEVGDSDPASTWELHRQLQWCEVEADYSQVVGDAVTAKTSPKSRVSTRYNEGPMNSAE